jgi:hypothetical protein
MRVLSTRPPRTHSLKTRDPLLLSKQSFQVFIAVKGVLVCLLWNTVVAAQTAPTLTPTVPLPNNPTVQIIPPAQTVCTQQYAPVCARIAGVELEYPNQCFAEAAGAEVVAEGPCTSTVISPLPN